MIHQSIICPNCRKSNPIARRKCRACGFSLLGTPPTTRIKQTDELTAGQRILINLTPIMITVWKTLIYAFVTLTILLSTVLIQPRYPVPNVSPLMAESFSAKLRCIENGTKTKVVISNTELNSFFHYRLKKILETHRRYFRTAQRLTIQAVFLKGDKVNILSSIGIGKLRQYINVRGKLKFSGKQLIFIPESLHYGYIRLPLKLLEIILHPMERTMLTHLSVPAYIKNVYVQGSHIFVEREKIQQT